MNTLKSSLQQFFTLIVLITFLTTMINIVQGTGCEEELTQLRQDLVKISGSSLELLDPTKAVDALKKSCKQVLEVNAVCGTDVDDVLKASQLPKALESVLIDTINNPKKACDA